MDISREVEGEKAVEAKPQPVQDVTTRPSIEIVEAQYQHADEALGFVEKHEGFTYTPEQDKAVLRKIDRHLMPLVYLKSYLPGTITNFLTDVHLLFDSIHG